MQDAIASQSHYHYWGRDLVEKHRMSEQHDERLSLPIEQGVLLWCMRAWVLEMRDPCEAEERINGMLDRFGTPGAAPHLKSFMSALSRNAARMINIQCTCCMRIMEDERAILDVLALAQAVQPFEALLLLRGLVLPEAAHSMLRSAERLGTIFAQAGRFLPAPDAEMRQCAAAAPTGAAARPAGAMLH